MKSDPASRRARNVVVLVIATVALPSLVLTALGVAAIRNEEVATKQRMEKLYYPLLQETSQVFNQRFDEVLRNARPALDDLLAWRGDPTSDLMQFRAFVDNTPEATNFFILNGEGVAQVPSFAAGSYTECCVASACFDPVDLTHADPNHRTCTAERRTAQVKRILKSACTSNVGADDETLRLTRTLLVDELPQDFRGRARYMAMATTLGARLSDPTYEIDPWWGQTVARALLFRLESFPADERRAAFGIVAAQSQREALLEGLTRVVRTKSDEVVVAGFTADGMRRLVVLLRDGEQTAGFELVSSAFGGVLNQLLTERDLDGMLKARVGPYEFPKWWETAVYPELAGLTKEQEHDLMVTWVLSSRSDLNWAFELYLADVGLMANLGRSRSGLYLWSLILVGTALILGIFYTVRSVIEEARLSRLKTDFVSSVSHDLRTPLTSIRMFSETLRAGRYDNDAERHEFLQIIIEEAERLSRLTERILDFSRMEAGKKAYRQEPTDFAELVHHALKATKPMVDCAEFEVEVDIEDGLPVVAVDRDAMLEVLINLYSNAIKYSPEHKWMGVQVTHNSNRLQIAVRDQGIGIRKADQSRIFDKFFRADTRRASEVSGSGIGLSLVKHIVENHSGTVSVQSVPGAGSTFIVQLPLVSSPACP